MLQKQEEEILNEEIDRDRLIAIETQDKELAKLLYEKVSFIHGSFVIPESWCQC